MIKSRNKFILILILCILLVFMIINNFTGNDYVKNDKIHKSQVKVNNLSKKEIKEFKYSDMLNSLNKCSNNFILSKVNKTDNSHYINIEVQYNGGIQELINSIEKLKNENFLKNINEIRISKIDENMYFSQISIDFYKFK